MANVRDSGAIPLGKIAKVRNDYELHYHEAGIGPAVVFIHGSGPGASGYSNFKGNYPVLADAGYHTIVPDLIGYGYSSKPEGVDYDLDLFSGTLFDLLDGLGIDECVLIGNSLGGAIAIDMALKHPQRIRTLVLMAPGGVEPMEVYLGMPGIKAMFGGFLGNGFTKNELGELMKMLTSDPAIVTPELLAERFPVYQSQPKDVLARLRIADASPRLKELQQPILGFWGVKDQFCPVTSSRKLVSECRDSRFILYGDCGHWVMNEKPEEFNAYVQDFLNLHRKSGRIG